MKMALAQDYGDGDGKAQSPTTVSASSQNTSEGSIYQKLGGNPAIDVLADRFISRILGTAPMGIAGPTGVSSKVTISSTQASAGTAAPDVTSKSKPMGTSAGMGGWDYTLVREYVRTKLCKITGGDCKVSTLNTSQMKAQPMVSDSQWDNAVSDLRQSLNSYNLTPQEQERLISAMSGMKKELVRVSTAKIGGDK